MTLGDRVVVMKDGVVQQSDAALRIYHHPENRFVAGFVGSPPMNFLSGQLVAEGDTLFFDEGSARLRVPPWAKDQLASRVGSEVVLGVRPEAMADRPRARFPCEDDSKISAGVKLVQPLGDKMDVYLATERHDHLVAHLDASLPTQAGERLDVYVDPAKVHFFEPGETGRRLAQNATKAPG